MDRLKILKEDKFLTNRILQRLSENMHYEIFKYLNVTDILQIRATNLGGYQLMSNRILRSRIKNYFKELPLDIKQPFQNDIYSSILLIFEQTGDYLLTLDGATITDRITIEFIKILRQFPQLLGINLCIYIHTIYI